MTAPNARRFRSYADFAQRSASPVSQGGGTQQRCRYLSDVEGRQFDVAIDRPQTTKMAERLLALPFDRNVERIALRISRCSYSQQWRCEHPLCPRCSARIAKRNRRRIERIIRGLAPEVKLALMTFTTGHDSITGGRAALVHAFAKLRRRAPWTACVSGGHVQIELLPAVGGSRRWNVHVHAVVELHAPPDVDAIRRAWIEILAEKDLPGSFKSSSVKKRFDEGKDDKPFSPAAFYATKRRRSEWLACSDEQSWRLLGSSPASGGFSGSARGSPGVASATQGWRRCRLSLTNELRRRACRRATLDVDGDTLAGSTPPHRLRGTPDDDDRESAGATGERESQTSFRWCPQ